MCAQLSDLLFESEPRVIGHGFKFTEGPLWHPNGFLLFTDIPANTVYRWEPGGQTLAYLKPSGNANGLTFDKQGNLLACEHGGRRVSRMVADRNMSTVADSYDGKKLNSPNDIVCHSSGRIYFTDPPYGIDPNPGEQGCNGVYCINTDGTVNRLFDDFGRPNGLALSPDESLLYVNDTVNRNIRVCRCERRRLCEQRPRVHRHERGSHRQPRRHEGRRGRQRVLHRGRWHLGHRPAGQSPRHDTGAPSADQYRLWQHRHDDAVHHGPPRDLRYPGKGAGGEPLLVRQRTY